MERITDYRYSELIGAAFRKIPKPISERLRYTHFFTGSDPVCAGLFDYEKTDDGRSYHDCWCVCYPCHLAKLGKNLRQTTVVMPTLHLEWLARSKPLLPLHVVHELGHVLDELLGFRYELKPVTQYAKTDRMEVFADAFTLWVEPSYAEFYQVLKPLDSEARYIFEGL